MDAIHAPFPPNSNEKQYDTNQNPIEPAPTHRFARDPDHARDLEPRIPAPRQRPRTISTTIHEPAAGPDLRRRGRRDLAERIVQRADALPAQDRALIRAIYADGKRVVELAALTGQPPDRLRRRIHRIARRTLDPRYAFVAARRDEWTRVRNRVATAVILHGLTLRQAAERLSLSLHAVRRHLAAVDALFEAELDARRRARLDRQADCA